MCLLSLFYSISICIHLFQVLTCFNMLTRSASVYNDSSRLKFPPNKVFLNLNPSDLFCNLLEVSIPLVGNNCPMKRLHSTTRTQ